MQSDKDGALKDDVAFHKMLSASIEDRESDKSRFLKKQKDEIHALDEEKIKN